MLNIRTRTLSIDHLIACQNLVWLCFSIKLRVEGKETEPVHPSSHIAKGTQKPIPACFSGCRQTMRARVGSLGNDVLGRGPWTPPLIQAKVKSRPFALLTIIINH
jgi:hypothetical protein